jgi:hypothetical protein
MDAGIFCPADGEEKNLKQRLSVPFVDKNIVSAQNLCASPAKISRFLLTNEPLSQSRLE